MDSMEADMEMEISDEMMVEIERFEAQFNLDQFGKGKAYDLDIVNARAKRYQMWETFRKIEAEYGEIDTSASGMKEAFHAFWMKVLRWAVTKLNKRPNVWLHYGAGDRFTDPDKLMKTVAEMIENLMPVSAFKGSDLHNYMMIWGIVNTKIAVERARTRKMAEQEAEKRPSAASEQKTEPSSSQITVAAQKPTVEVVEAEVVDPDEMIGDRTHVTTVQEPIDAEFAEGTVTGRLDIDQAQDQGDEGGTLLGYAA